MRTRFIPIDEENTQAIIFNLTPEESDKVSEIVSALYEDYEISGDEISFRFGWDYPPRSDKDLDVTEFRKVLEAMKSLGIEVDYDSNLPDEKLDKERSDSCYLHDCFVNFLYEFEDDEDYDQEDEFEDEFPEDEDQEDQVPYGIQIRNEDGEIAIELNYQNFNPALVDKIDELLEQAVNQDVIGFLPSQDEVSVSKIIKLYKTLKQINNRFEELNFDLIWYSPSDIRYEISSSYLYVTIDRDKYQQKLDEFKTVLKKVLEAVKS